MEAVGRLRDGEGAGDGELRQQRRSVWCNLMKVPHFLVKSRSWVGPK